ncbi:hypothetical protein AALC17_06890 [Oscillospiraceae bacterium 38-13]
MAAALSVISSMEGDNQAKMRVLTSAGVFGSSAMGAFPFVGKLFLFHVLIAPVDHLYLVNQPENRTRNVRF